ncbi:MAG TPA: histidine kinase, partial [Gaiellaceae bacterium]
FAALLVSGSWFAGLLMRRRAEALRAAERDRDAAATSERMRIARELHDIVSHRVTTVVVQAQAAHATLATDPEATRRSLEAVDVAGRQALAELRDLLGVLRTDGGAGGRAPQPGLEDLPRLVDEARARGVPASLTVEGAAYDVEPGIALAAYRVVQEALTNVAKHAGSAPTEVLVRYGSGALEVHVVDTGPGGPARRRGHGLVGMEERAALYGGSVQAGEAAGGGFAVRLALPVRTS